MQAALGHFWAGASDQVVRESAPLAVSPRDSGCEGSRAGTCTVPILPRGCGYSHFPRISYFTELRQTWVLLQLPN